MQPASPEPPRSSPKCPFCGGREAEVISLFGTQAMTLQYHCLGCGSVYEAIKYDRAESGGGGRPPAAPRPGPR